MSNSKHPSGLPYLFFSEMWERFGYYLMIGILVLYMKDTEKGGLAMDTHQASDIYGTFIALVFLTPFIGGLLADRIMGYRLAITIGGILMGLGYCCLALAGINFFYLGLLLIILGNGFFKPNISTLLGNLYNDDRYRSLKDNGYSIFYMGINVGAFICNFFAAYMRNVYDWGSAFLTAGVGMFIGVIVLWIGSKHYKHADVLKPAQKEDLSLGKISGIVLLPALLAGFLGWMIPENIFGSDSTDAFIFGTIPVIGYYVSLWVRASQQDKRPLGALLAIFGVAVVFWAVFKQNGTALTIWAENYTDRRVPAMVEKPLDAIKLVKQTGIDLKSVAKVDAQFRTTKVNGEIVKHTSHDLYFNNLPHDQWPAEGESIPLLNTEIFQSINPFFVIVLTPVVMGLFLYLRKRKKEPTTASKIFIGLLITAVSALCMIGAVYSCSNGEIKCSPWWLIATYGVITLGELCLSPMGLSLVSKLSPPRLTALMMGGWFLSTSLGNKLSGVLASMWDKYDDKSYFFMVNFVLTIVSVITIFLMLKWLNGIMKEHLGENLK
jgi:proton-dependent oligopeptide transporter, POT family